MTALDPGRGEDCVARARRAGIRVFGAGGFARAVASAARRRGVEVHAFVTSGTPPLATLDGIPVRRADAGALSGLPIWVAVFNRESHSDYSTLRGALERLAPAAELVWPQHYYESLSESLGFRFWLEPLAAYAAAAAAIDRGRALLEDAPSRAAYDAVLAFRRMVDAGWRSPVPSADVQYLPAWLRATLPGPLRLVDAGAYRGETLRALAALAPIERAYTFEPDTANYAALVHGLADFPAPVIHVPAGVSDRGGVAGFAAGLGEASALSDSGQIQVPVVTIDECLHRAPVNFIKLDVEGHEMAALAGARRTLERARPTLAIAAYHRWDDLWRIPEFLAGLDLGYRLRLGLHGHNSFDTVLYAY